MQPQTSKIIFAVFITAVVVGGGVYFWQKQLNTVGQLPTTTTSPVASVEKVEKVEKQVTSENPGTTYSSSTYDITYPKGWAHKSSGLSDYFFKGDVPSDAQLFTSKQTSLIIAEPAVATDQGMCLTKIAEKTLTTKSGLTFDLTFNTNDKEGEICKDAFDHDFVQVFIGNSLNKWMYFTYIPSDTQAEKELEDLLQSIQVK